MCLLHVRAPIFKREREKERETEREREFENIFTLKATFSEKVGTLALQLPKRLNIY